MKVRSIASLVAATLAAAAGFTYAAAGAIRSARDRDREVKWKVSEILDVVGAQRGSRIADIGCGEGFLTFRLASSVGPEGHVFAVDIDDSALGKLKHRVEEASAKNVEIVRGKEADPLLAPDSLDGAIVLRAYHEFSRHQEMLEKIRAALRPGGRIVIADVGPVTDGRTRESQVAQHVLSHEIAEKELVEAGYHVIRSAPSFAQVSSTETVWLIAAERPRA